MLNLLTKFKFKRIIKFYIQRADFDNLPTPLRYGAVEQDILLSTFDGLEGSKSK